MNKYLAILVFALLVMLGVAERSSAQHSEEPLVVGWTEIAPLFRAEPDGRAGGFGAEIMREVAERAGFHISFRKFSRAEDLIRAQVLGNIDLMPAIAALPVLAENNIFSDPIAQTHMRIFIRTEDAETLDPATMADVRIAVPGVPVGTEGTSFIARNVPVAIPVSTNSIMELLRGTVDALIASDNVTIADAHALRLDHRILAVGPPLRSFDRVITLRRELADLMPAINQAIAELEADGTLEELRGINRVSVAPLEPDVLKVGVFHAPPYSMINPDGTFSGFSVDTIRHLTKSAGIAIEFVEIDEESLALGPAPDRYDLLPQAAVNEEARQRMDFTAPIDRASFAVFTRVGEGRQISDLYSLMGSRLGVEAVGVARQLAENHEGLELRIFDGPDALLNGLLVGQVDAILYPRHAITVAAARLGVQDQIREIETPIHSVDRAIALRFGLGQTRERLNAVIPGYLASSMDTQIREEYFGTPVFWTDSRITFVRNALIIGAVSLLLLFIAWARWRQKRTTQARRKFASTLVDQIPLGMVLVSPQGVIEFANQFVKDRTPDGHALMKRGNNFKKMVETLIDNGTISMNGRTKEAFLGQLDGNGLRLHSANEFKFSGGKTYVRTTLPLGADGTLLTYADVTEDRRQLTEIRNLNAKLLQQVSLASAANAELRAFAYATSHDLKAPTNTTSLLISELGEALAPHMSEDDAEMFEDLTATNQRMAQLIDDVLEYTNAIGSEMKRSEVDMDVLLSEILDDLKADIIASGAEIERAPLPKINAHPAQMRQLLQNLISNAIKFRAPDRPPKISVTTERSRRGEVAFAVTDNGIGMRSELQGRIFTPFTRLNAQEDYAGSGLGLAICQRIAMNHGGKIEVTSDVGEGSQFRVRIKES
ncbi:ATP-binding protein [Shimia sp.]|uniref:ATP-binding protein n=1 Tax=Shimia sp. TaxID=1954381 RepID=UPI003BAA2EFB